MIRKIFVGLVITVTMTLLSGCQIGWRSHLVEPVDINWCENQSANKMIGYYNARYPEEPIEESDILLNEPEISIIRITDEVFYVIEDKDVTPTYTVGGYSKLNDENRKEFLEYADRLSASSICFLGQQESRIFRQGNAMPDLMKQFNGPYSLGNGERVQRYYNEYNGVREKDGVKYVILMSAYEIPKYMPSDDSKLKLLD